MAISGNDHKTIISGNRINECIKRRRSRYRLQEQWLSGKRERGEFYYKIVKTKGQKIWKHKNSMTQGLC